MKTCVLHNYINSNTTYHLIHIVAPPISNTFLCNRSNTRKGVSSDFQTLRSRLEKQSAAEFFVSSTEVFLFLPGIDNVEKSHSMQYIKQYIKHEKECFIKYPNTEK